MGHFDDVVGQSGFNNKPVPGRMLAGFCEYLLKAFNSAHATNTRRIEALERRLREVESKGVVYRGLWDGAANYGPGDMATYGGSMWHCNAETIGNRPNCGDGTWQLAVKRGRDARGVE
jgi:hypothetical protein